MRSTAALAILMLFAALAHARDDRPLKSAKSENGRFMLRLQPGAAVPEAPVTAEEREPEADAERERGASDPAQTHAADTTEGEESVSDPQGRDTAAREGSPAGNGCRATLFERRGGDFEKRYAVRLVNRVAPAMAFISDDGRHLVTLDDYERGGAAHAVVLYDENGRMRREFSLRDLLTREDWSHVRERRGRLEWLAGAKAAFKESPSEPMFVIRLRWGEEIRIDLGAAALHGDREVATADDVPDELAALLSADLTAMEASDAGDLMADDPSETRVAQTEAPDGLAALRALDAEALQSALAADAAAHAAQEEAVVAELLAQAQLDIARQPPADAPEQDRKAVAEMLRSIELSQAAAITPGIEQAPQTLADPGFPVAGLSAAAGAPVPLPNPVEPVDYGAWLRGQIAADQSPAADMIASAAASYVELKSSDLLGAAMQGDPNALQSPEVRAWLDANRGAIDQIQAASAFPYNGLRIEANDGPLVSALMPSLGPMRQLARAAVVDGKRLEFEGRRQEAAEQYVHVAGVGGQYARGSTLIETLVGAATQSMAQESLLDAYAADDGTLDYEALSAQLDRQALPGRPMAATIQFERAGVLDVVQRGYEYNPDSGTYRVTPESATAVGSTLGLVNPDNPSPMQQLMVATWLSSPGFEKLSGSVNDEYDAMTQLAQQPYAAARAGWEELEARYSSPVFRSGNPLFATLIPALNRATENTTRAEAHRRATNLVTRLQAYRQRTGGYPESLDALDGQAPRVDPYTGQPFVYRRDADGFSLRSVGSDGAQDDPATDAATPRAGRDQVYWPRPAKPTPPKR